MFEHELSHALRDLTNELREMRQERMLGLATKCDWREMEQRIMAAFNTSMADAGKIVEATQALRKSTDTVEQAVAQNSPESKS